VGIMRVMTEVLSVMMRIMVNAVGVMSVMVKWKDED